MTDDLALRLNGSAQTLNITAVGAIHVDNAHRLPKVVVGLLHQHAVDAVVLDLSAVTRIDDVGVAAVVLCGRETVRRGIRFSVAGYSPAVRQTMCHHGAAHLLTASPAGRHGTALRRRHTGTVCPTAMKG